MDLDDDQGLGLSLLIYMAAIATAFAVLVVMPVYVYSGPTVYPSSRVTSFSQIAAMRERDFPLARIKNDEIVDPAILEGLNARSLRSGGVERAHRPRAHAERGASRPARSTGQPVVNPRSGPFARMYSGF
jgi:hypothetical protein